jgi:flagellar assembly protein FliH
MSDAETTAAPNSPVPDVQPWRAPEVGRSGKGPLTAERLALIEQQAHADGYRRGLEEGRRDGTDEMHRRAAELERLLHAIQPFAGVLDDELIEQLGDLVVAITRQLVRRELKHEPGEVVRVVRDALAALPVSDAVIRVHLHPEDAELVRRVVSPDTVERQVRVVEDVTLSRGGARVETDVSVVDASVERRLAELAAAVFGDERALSAEPGEGPSDERSGAS